MHCVSLGRACAVLPPVSLWFRSWNSFPASEEMLPTAQERACSSCCPRCWCAQRTNSDSHFFGPVCGLLRAIACRAVDQACWTVPTRRSERWRRPARADCAGRALGDGGSTIAHGRCAASMLHYAMRIGHIGVTSFITNPSGKACRRPRKV